MEKKRRHHYVWKKYLQSWTRDEKIWCYRDGELFPSSLNNVALIKDFYKLNDLNFWDVKFIKWVINQSSYAHLKKLNQRWLQYFKAVFELLSIAEQNDIDDSKLNELMDEVIHNYEEDLLGGIENQSVKYIDSILNEDVSFYQTDEGCIDFSYFIGVQYFRTRSIKESFDDIFAIFEPINSDNVMPILRQIFANNVGWSLYRDRDSYQMVLLKNKSSMELITADQPVLNTYGAKSVGFEEVEDLELYYPVAPDIAILITKDFSGEAGKKVLTETEVEGYNSMIIDESYSQIYATSKEKLLKNGLRGQT